MYSTYTIENGPRFVFDGRLMTVGDAGTIETVIDREELENLVEWLKLGLEKLNRDHWDAVHEKSCTCDCVRPA